MAINVDELINQEVDGVNTPEEQALLRDILKDDVQARERLEQLAAAVDRVSTLSLVEAPVDLRGRVMAALPPEHVPVRDRVADWLAVLRATIQGRPVIGYAWSLALGIVIGVGVISLGRGEGTATQHVVGTLAVPGAVTEQLVIDTAGVRGLVRRAETATIVSLDLSLETRAPVDVQLTFTETDLTLRDIQRLGPPARTVGADGGQLLLVVEDSATYRLIFERKTQAAAPVRVQLLREGEAQFEETIPSLPS